MKANELRIGNYIWLKCHHFPVKVEGIFRGVDGPIWIETDLHEGEKIEDFEPIPLTEEWFYKLGFQSYGHIYTLHFESGFALSYNTSLKSWFLSIHSTTTTAIRDFKYVHEIQKFYYAATGKDVVIRA